MTIHFFKTLYKVLTAFLVCTVSLKALSPEQELRTCKRALLSQINEQKRLRVSGCPVSQHLIVWLGILRNPEQFTPSELISFLESHPHWPQHEKLCKKAEVIISKKGSPKELFAWFKKHPPKTVGGVIVYAKMLQKRDKQKLITTTWETMEMTRKEEKEFLSQFGCTLSQKNHQARLQFQLWNEDVEGAKRLFAYVSAPSKHIATLRIALQNGTPPKGTLPLNDEGLRYETVKWYKKQKNWGEAAKILTATPPSKTYAQKWWKERHYVVRELLELKQYQKAYQLLKQHNLDPGTQEFAEAHWLSGWIALRFLKKPLEAQHHFEILSKNVKAAISKARVAYWLGRTHEKKKERTLAQKWYRKAAYYKTTFYGQLAAHKLKETPYPTLKKALNATAQEVKKFHQKDLVKAAHILKGLGKDASHELSKFLNSIATQAKTKIERELAVQLAATFSPHDVVWIAKQAGKQDPVLLRIAYPVCHLPQKPGLPERALLLAIAYRESDFNARAVSPKGAMGLLQLVSKTAAEAAKRLGVHHTDAKLFNPSHNLLLGSTHVSTLLNNFNHSYLLTTAAYNAGPTPINRWIKTFGHPHKTDHEATVDWVELIPYAETRNYVQGVLANVTNYRSREGTPQKTLVHDLKKHRHREETPKTLKKRIKSS